MREPAVPTTDPWVRGWLSGVFLMILAMAMIGATTRLTESGLSIVEWAPISGTLPPLSEAAWVVEFEKYRATPQYQLVNAGMSLDDFKRIFFWEYVHRLFGRLIGFVVLLPWLFFLATGRIRGAFAGKTFLMLVLGGLQGLLGWYMVQSGLVDMPRVSHLRLAAHLLLAFFVALYVLWLRLSLDESPPQARLMGTGGRLALVGLLMLFFVQCAWGAFMAGTRAGHFSRTFPDVQGHYLPSAFASSPDLWTAIVFEAGPIHTTHRLLAWACLAAVLLLVPWLLRRGPPQTRAWSWALLGLTLGQVTLGAATVMTGVSLPIAVAHQGLALLLLGSVLGLIERSGRGRWVGRSA